jgi:hypothetical protein
MIEIKRIDNPGEECIAIIKKIRNDKDLLLTDLVGTFSIGTVLSFESRSDGSMLITDVDDKDNFLVIR